MAKKKKLKPIARLKSKRAIMNRLKNPRGWKLPTKRVTVRSRAAAERIQEALCYYTGGAEIVKSAVPHKRGTDPFKVRYKYRVGSKGYYHYIGA